MPVEPELSKMLNMLNSSRSFVLTEHQTIEKLERLPPEAGLSMVAGQSSLPNGDMVDSVFEVEADGGELHRVYWLIDGAWHDSSDEAARRLIAPTNAELFPFDWTPAVPLEVDHFHVEPPLARRPKHP